MTASKEKFGSINNDNAVGEWWDSTFSCSGTNCRNVREAYAAGYIRSHGSVDDDEPITGATTNESSDENDVSLKFVNTTSQTVILCWVSETGELHHYYRIFPRKSHVEVSTKGHAFIISYCPAREAKQEENDIPEVTEENIIAAYRVLSYAVSDHLILMKSFPSRVPATTDSNIMNTYRKNKWKLYPFIDNQNKVYNLEMVGPWRLQVEPGCWDDGEEDCYNAFKSQFMSDLIAATERLPKHAVEKLAKTTAFWINKSWLQGKVNDPSSENGACFHEDREWLKSNFHSVEKKFGIEFYSTDEYLSDFHLWGPGGVILHELSHAWHKLHVKYGYNNREVIKCYRLAMKEKMYECVQYHTLEGVNDETRAYACNNAAEYFAELSVAFFSNGCNVEHPTIEEDEKQEKKSG